MFFLLEISVDKFIKRKNQTKSPLEALNFAMSNYFIKALDNYEYNSWRKVRYYNEEMDNYIKAFLPLIDGIFHTFGKKYIKNNEKDFNEIKSLNGINTNYIKEKEIIMTQEGFSNLVKSFVNTSEFDVNKIPLIFHISKRFNVNEISDDKSQFDSSAVFFKGSLLIPISKFSKYICPFLSKSITPFPCI